MRTKQPFLLGEYVARYGHSRRMMVLDWTPRTPVVVCGWLSPKGEACEIEVHESALVRLAPRPH